jgi:serine/threonine protein kinase
MSVVWRAYDEVLRRPVAVKLLAAQLRDEELLRAEAQAAALLSHPNVSAVYDYGVADDEPFVVMELLQGISLAARLARGPLPWRGAVEVCAQVAAALSAAHARGLAHRDVKPGNIMLTEAGVKVIDFGIAAFVDSRTDGPRLGTLGYLAPERLAGEVGGPAADVYALGIVLFAALTGQPPRPADRSGGLLRADLQPKPLPLVPGMPSEIVALYKDCLAADPRIRPSAATLAHQLADLAGIRVGAVDMQESAGYGDLPPPTDSQTLAGTTASLTPQRSRRPRLTPRKIAILGVALIIALAFGTVRFADVGTSAASCSVAYRVKETWDNGATVSLSIANTGKTDIRQWRLEFDLQRGLQARSGWNGTWRQQGTHVTVKPMPDNADLAAGTLVSGVGTNIDGPRASSIPDRFELNGGRCQIALQPVGLEN